MVTKALTRNRALEVATAPKIVGIDFGYGWTKAVLDDTEVMFPSVIARATNIKFQREEILTEFPGMLVTDPETQEDWFVGKLAIRQAAAADQIRLDGRDNGPEETKMFRKILLYTALGLLFPYRNGEIVNATISTGLPVDHMSDAPEMKTYLIGQHRVRTDQRECTVLVEKAFVMPQPKGTIYHFMYDENGDLREDYGASRVAVGDFGRVTIDLTVDEDGLFVDDEGGSLEGGVFRIERRITEMYEEIYKAKPSYSMVDKILREGQALVSGVLTDFRKMRAEAVQPMIDSALSMMGRKWAKALEIEIIYIAGGGAELVFPAIKAKYPQAVLVKEPQLSNARGYRNYAKHKAQKSA